MLSGISKLLTGDVLKILCDMGHGDEIVISDANFPAASISDRVIYCPGMNVSDVLEAIKKLFPLDVKYSDKAAFVMELTDSDKTSGMPDPESWADYERILKGEYENFELGKIERFAFYDRAKEAYAVILTGEERQYGNILLKKGVVL